MVVVVAAVTAATVVVAAVTAAMVAEATVAAIKVVVDIDVTIAIRSNWFSKGLVGVHPQGLFC
jgi:hypothetical protein